MYSISNRIEVMHNTVPRSKRRAYAGYRGYRENSFSIGVVHLPAGCEPPGPPDCGISDCRPHFKNTSRMVQPGQLIKKLAHGGPHNGSAVLRCLIFHFGQHGVPRLQKLVHVLFNGVISDSGHLL